MRKADGMGTGEKKRTRLDGSRLPSSSRQRDGTVYLLGARRTHGTSGKLEQKSLDRLDSPSIKE